MIDLYTKPGCRHCDMAKEFLTEHGIDVREIDITQNADALAFIKSQGHQTVPQLYVGTTLLVGGGNSGMRTLGIEELKRRISTSIQV